MTARYDHEPSYIAFPTAAEMQGTREGTEEQPFVPGISPAPFDPDTLPGSNLLNPNLREFLFAAEKG